MHELLQNKYAKGLIVIGLVGIVTALAAYTNLAWKQAESMKPNQVTISVSGKGEVLAKPDIGTFTFSVQTEGKDATTAQTQGTKAMDTITKYLADNGVEDKDIKTTNYNLSPKYKYENKVCPAGTYCPPGNRVQDGFTVNQSVTVKVRKLDQAGALISGVGDKGATNISSLSFTIDDDSALQSQAREKAIKDAKAKAEELAKSLGLKIDRIVGFNESGQGPVYYGMGGSDTMMAKSEAAPSAVVPTGQNTITSNVNIVYALK